MSNEWRAVIGLETLYEVSRSGQVRRTGRDHGATVGRILRQRPGFGGYPVVRLKKRTCYVHRLVAAAFIGPCPVGMEVNHKDLNRCNPLVDNLEYMTRSDNNKHAFRNGRISIKGEAKTNSVLTSDLVRTIRASSEGPRSAGRRFGVSHVTIIAIRRRTKWSHVPDEVLS